MSKLIQTPQSNVSTMKEAASENRILNNVWHTSDGIKFQTRPNRSLSLETTWKPTDGIKFLDKQSTQSVAIPLENRLSQGSSDSYKKKNTINEDHGMPSTPVSTGDHKTSPKEPIPPTRSETRSEIINEGSCSSSSPEEPISPTILETRSEITSEGSCSNFQIPEAELRKAMLANGSTAAAYWRYSLYEDSKGSKPLVHYCQSLKTTERVAQLFLGKTVIGFDIEWKPNATSEDGVKKNVSLIQLASEERIALFHVARYAKDGVENLVSLCLKRVMEDPNITKVGVSVKSDCTRLAKYMGIQARGIFELSHLYKLIKHSTGNIKLIDKKLVALAKQVEEHLQLPLFKGSVRSSDWSEALSYDQIRYAASDSYAGLQLYNLMETKRNALIPTPPRPAHAELNLPILLANGQTVSAYDMSEDATVDETPSKDDAKEPIQIEEMARDFTSITIEDSELTDPTAELKKQDISTSKPPEIVSAESWIQQWRMDLPADYKPKVTTAFLRAYFLWHYLDKTVTEAAIILRDPPLQKTTVANYILEALRIERLPYQVDKVADVLVCLPDPVSKRRYQTLWKEVN